MAVGSAGAGRSRSSHDMPLAVSGGSDAARDWVVVHDQPAGDCGKGGGGKGESRGVSGKAGGVNGGGGAAGGATGGGDGHGHASSGAAASLWHCVAWRFLPLFTAIVAPPGAK